MLPCMLPIDKVCSEYAMTFFCELLRLMDQVLNLGFNSMNKWRTSPQDACVLLAIPPYKNKIAIYSPGSSE